MNKEQSIKALQISAILFKYNVPIAEVKFIGSFIEELIQENQKLKEKIKNIVEYAYGTDMLVCEYEELCKIAEVE